MKTYSKQATTKMLCAVAVFACVSSASAYEFNVTNSTKSKIIKVQASEDGKKWGEFDMGTGLAAGETSTITWDAGTDSSGCEWQVKASYADGSDSFPAKFDFCEQDLEIEFTE